MRFRMFPKLHGALRNGAPEGPYVALEKVHGAQFVVGLHTYFLFFQAEDGIRDLIVTGVKTCALPISGRPSRRHPEQSRGGGQIVRCIPNSGLSTRSEERRVGKECRSRWSPYN